MIMQDSLFIEVSLAMSVDELLLNNLLKQDGQTLAQFLYAKKAHVCIDGNGWPVHNSCRGSACVNFPYLLPPAYAG
ncbi:MAG: hypothetical protein HYR68_11310 [Burkholderiales bacterium]|nr:hypothetical protein [Burkholderiales bacterium]MBI3727151.1 hypothetical protein [Burkholderiales bacterium]